MIRLLGFLSAQVRFIVAGVGLALLAGGFAMAWLPLALIIPGGLLVGLAVVGALRETRRVGS